MGCLGAPEEESVDATESAIINGAVETGYPEVVFLELGGQGSCTGTLISPRVVLTAKHCILDYRQNAAGVRVGVGATFDPTGPQRNPPRPMIPVEQRYSEVVQIRTTPGDDIEGKDVAVLLLKAKGTLKERGWVTTTPDLTNATITAVGFGQRVVGPSGSNDATGRPPFGHKFLRGNVSVIDSNNVELAIAGPTTCYGDSGGPAILADGRVVGVVSRGVENCNGFSIYTRTDPYATLINQAITDTTDAPLDTANDQSGNGDGAEAETPADGKSAEDSDINAQRSPANNSHDVQGGTIGCSATSTGKPSASILFVLVLGYVVVRSRHSRTSDAKL